MTNGYKLVYYNLIVVFTVNITKMSNLQLDPANEAYNFIKKIKDGPIPLFTGTYPIFDTCNQC